MNSNLTRNEAIEILKNDELCRFVKCDCEALDMAIEALEQHQQLANRCFALTLGAMCSYCPIECEARLESEDNNA